MTSLATTYVLTNNGIKFTTLVDKCEHGHQRLKVWLMDLTSPESVEWVPTKKAFRVTGVVEPAPSHFAVGPKVYELLGVNRISAFSQDIHFVTHPCGCRKVYLYACGVLDIARQVPNPKKCTECKHA